MPRASARSSSSAPTHFGVGFGEELVERGAAVGEPAAGELKGEADPEQALLGAVVEVALEASTLGVAGFDDAAREARTSASWARSSACRRAFSSARLAAAPTASTSAGSSSERRVVDERGEAVAVVLEHRDGAARLARRGRALLRRGRRSVTVGEPEGELERVVAQRAGDRVADLGRRRERAQLDDEIGDRGAVQPGAQQTDQERDRDRDEATSPTSQSRTIPAISAPTPRRRRRTTHEEHDRHGGEHGDRGEGTAGRSPRPPDPSARAAPRA